MSGHDDQGTVVYREADDQAARAIAYLGPYLFWGVLGAISVAVLMLV